MLPPFIMKWLGSKPLTGDGHSSNTVYYTIPTALGQDPKPVILKIPEFVRSTREHFHFVWNPSVMPLVLEKRHVATMGSSYDRSVAARMRIQCVEESAHVRAAE